MNIPYQIVAVPMTDKNRDEITDCIIRDFFFEDSGITVLEIGAPEWQEAKIYPNGYVEPSHWLIKVVAS